VFVRSEVLFDHVASAGKSGTGCVEHRGMRVKAGFLRNIGDAQVLLKLQGAVIGLVQAGQYLQQR